MALAVLASVHHLAAQGTAFLYQGLLSNGTNSANGSYDLSLSLFDAGTDGAQVGSTLTNLNVGVTNGLFMVTADFGAVFNGAPLWLQIGVRTNGGETFTALSPRQELTPVPYSITAENLTGMISLAQLPVATGLLSEPGSVNVFAGPNAGNLTVTGFDNVGIGGSALSSITSGNYNTAVGEGSLLTSTSASNNTAIGFDAMIGPLFGMTTGSGNTALGMDAAAFDSTGSNNTAVGMNALLLNTIGNDDTATGAYALGGGRAITTGGGDSGFGGSTLYSLTTGYNNTAVGYEALYANTTGVDNVGVGVATFQASPTGSQNTAIGTYAFQNMTAGNGNVGLGYYAGNALVAGTNNIYIGHPGSANDNNVIRIGNGQTETYIDSTIALDGYDTNNGVTYIPAGGLPGINGGQGPFLFGFDGGWLGAVLPQTVCLSWDYLGNVWISNNISTGTLTIRGGSDLAEPFKITSGKDEVPQGSVVVIDEENPGHLKVSRQPYDTRVAGVLSGANGINPGIQMQQQGLVEGGRNVALTGRVYVQADASNGAIKPGDLLTTSTAPGRAMKVTDHLRAQGAILGKAMTGLSQGNGMVLVLVTLQ